MEIDLDTGILHCTLVRLRLLRKTAVFSNRFASGFLIAVQEGHCSGTGTLQMKVLGLAARKSIKISHSLNSLQTGNGLAVWCGAPALNSATATVRFCRELGHHWGKAVLSFLPATS